MDCIETAMPEARDILSIDGWLRRFADAAPADIAIFQNVYGEAVIDQLDPSFLPIDGRRNARTETREVGLFLRMFHSGLYRCASLTGILSPRFTRKTRVAGAEFLHFIRQHPGYDVYFLNPFPQNSYYAYNVWYNGEFNHPGLLPLAEILFARAGYGAGLIHEPRDGPATALYSSYWVGGRAFWEGYVAMLTRLIETLESMPASLRGRFLDPAPNYPDPVPISTFILERSFSAFLHFRPEIRALSFPFTRGQILGYCGDAIETEIVANFGEVIEEIDDRQQYTEADRNLFFALTKLRLAGRRWL